MQEFHPKSVKYTPIKAEYYVQYKVLLLSLFQNHFYKNFAGIRNARFATFYDNRPFFSKGCYIASNPNVIAHNHCFFIISFILYELCISHM